MNPQCRLTIGFLLALALPPSLAHHGWGPHYDGNAHVTVTGVITKFEFVNPHAFVYMEVVNESGETQTRWCEMQSRTQLQRRGVGEEQFRVGSTITIQGFMSRQDPLGCEFGTGHFHDGTVPFVGPDIDGKFDSHANELFATEGSELRNFLVEHDMIVICGDRHWQYVSVHEETGLREYATGAASDSHAGAWTPGDVRPEHLYVNVVGGFLSVTAERQANVPTLTLRNHGVDGEVLFEDILISD